MNARTCKLAAVSTQSFDPWSTGTQAYRICLVTGMLGSAIGVILVVIAALVGDAALAATLRSIGLVALGIGILSHLIAIGLRRRQAVHIMSRRVQEDD